MDALIDDLETTKKDGFESVIAEDRERFSTAFEKDEKEGYDDGFDDSYDDGLEEGRKDASKEFVATIPCSKCGEAVAVTTETRRREVYELVDKLNDDWTASPPPGILECDIRHDCPAED